jgi:hypothetical protein
MRRMIMNLGIIKNVVMKTTGRAILHVKKFSPEILMVTGVVGIIAGTVMACKATLKVEEIKDTARLQVEKIKLTKAMVDEGECKVEYTNKDYTKDMLLVMVQTGMELTKLYGPAVLVSAASIGCILGSHGIMRKRNFALVAAYKAVEKSFTDYRNRVIAEFGPEKDRLLKNGIVQSKAVVITTDENGNMTQSEQIVESVDKNGMSQYARFFDEVSVNWSKTPEYNLTFLLCQQNYMNDLLQSRGHVFLNEVYDHIGIPRSQAGAIVGWVRDSEFGDGFVDFGIGNGGRTAVRNFVNGHEVSILLDFNVDGVVYDMI